MNKLVISKRSLVLGLKLLCSTLFAIWFANIPHEIFLDRANYLNYLTNADSIIEIRSSRGYLNLLANEPAWLYINSILGGVSNSVQHETILKVYPFLITLVASYYILISRNDFVIPFVFLVLFLLVIPHGLSYTLGGLRQSIATTFLLLFVIVNKDKKVNHIKVVFLLFILSFIHSLFFVITVTYFFAFFGKKIKDIPRGLGLVVYASIAILALLFLLKFSGLSDYARQGESLENQVSHSGFLFFIYLTILILFVKIYPTLALDKNPVVANTTNLAFVFLVAYLMMYWVMPGTGRILNSLIPFLFFLIARKINRYTLGVFLLIMLVVFLTVSPKSRANSTYLNYEDYYQYVFFIKK